MKKLVATLSIVGLVCCSGCTSVARRGLAEIKGADAKVYPIKALSSGKAQAASAPKIGAVTTDGSGATQFRAALKLQLIEKVAEAKAKGDIRGSGSPLTIKCAVRFYSSKGAGKLMGGMAFAVVRVELVDHGGQVVAKADALASTKALRTNTEDLADALAKKLIKWASTGRT